MPCVFGGFWATPRGLRPTSMRGSSAPPVLGRLWTPRLITCMPGMQDSLRYTWVPMEGRPPNSSSSGTAGPYSSLSEPRDFIFVSAHPSVEATRSSTRGMTAFSQASMDAARIGARGAVARAGSIAPAAPSAAAPPPDNVPSDDESAPELLLPAPPMSIPALQYRRRPEGGAGV